MRYNPEVLAVLAQDADSVLSSSERTKAIWDYLLNQHAVTEPWSVKGGQLDLQKLRHVDTDLALVYHPIGVQGSKPFPVILLDTFKPRRPPQGTPSEAINFNSQDVTEFIARSSWHLSSDADFFNLRRMWGVSAIGRKFKLWRWDMEELACVPYTDGLDGDGKWLDVIDEPEIIEHFVNEAMNHADILADAMGQTPDGFPDVLMELLGESFGGLSANAHVEQGL